MNTKIETFLTYMLVLFLTIAFESSLRAANKSSQFELIFNSRIPPTVNRDDAIKITDVDSNNHIYSAHALDIQAYYNNQGSFILKAKFRPIKVTITGTAAGNKIDVNVTSFYISSTAFAFPASEKGIDLVTTTKKTPHPWNVLWHLKIITPRSESSIFNNHNSKPLDPDQNNGKTYTVELIPSFTIIRSDILPDGGPIHGTVRVDFSADITQ